VLTGDIFSRLGWLWFSGTMLPKRHLPPSNIVPFAQFVADSMKNRQHCTGKNLVSSTCREVNFSDSKKLIP